MSMSLQTTALSAQCNFFSTSKAVKLALGLTAVAGAIALGVVLGLNTGSDKQEVVQAASSPSSVKSVVAENYAPGKETKPTEQEFYTSSGLLKPKSKWYHPPSQMDMKLAQIWRRTSRRH
jgi:hypothetical protein